MTQRVRFASLAIVSALGITVLAASRLEPPVPGMTFANEHGTSSFGVEDEGYPIDNETVIAQCERCHEQDEQGRMSRISFERKTPEGWQTSIRRMVALNNVRLKPEEAREVVRYLSNQQGLAPEELEPGRFEVERRIDDYDYEGDDDVEFTCIQCHSMGRVITQRRTREEWALLLATHRGLYPLADRQGFRYGGFAREQGDDDDSRQPMDIAIDHLSEAFPLETPEWSSWSASMRPPRLAGTWALAGFESGKGRVFGTLEIVAGNTPDEFTTSAEYTYAESGESIRSTGQAVIYTGYQWRGRSNRGDDGELREVMMVDREWQDMDGRWFTGAYDEFGIDVELRRTRGEAVLTGVHPRALRAGAGATEVRLYGANLPTDASPTAFDFGPGVRVESVTAANPNVIALRAYVEDTAMIGGRDLFLAGANLTDAVQIHDGVDRIEVSPDWGMARVGGATNFPKGYQAFDAIGWDNGPDGQANTLDDLDLGRITATWSMEEYTATFDDDDIAYVGELGPDGIFTPAEDGPNLNRKGSQNNVGDVWIVATHAGPEAMANNPLQARAHLIVTVPLYLKFDPWQSGLMPGRLVP